LNKKKDFKIQSDLRIKTTKDKICVVSERGPLNKEINIRNDVGFFVE